MGRPFLRMSDRKPPNPDHMRRVASVRRAMNLLFEDTSVHELIVAEALEKLAGKP